METILKVFFNDGIKGLLLLIAVVILLFYALKIMLWVGLFGGSDGDGGGDGDAGGGE